MKILKALILAAMIICFAAINTSAWAGGSDSPTPYTVTVEGVQLPDGMVFPADGHVNWRTTEGSFGMHFDPNNDQPGGRFIGESFFPFNLQPGECIEWVQVSLFNEHFGEGGQPPICKSVPELTEPSGEPSEPEPETPRVEVGVDEPETVETPVSETPANENPPTSIPENLPEVNIGKPSSVEAPETAVVPETETAVNRPVSEPAHTATVQVPRESGVSPELAETGLSPRQFVGVVIIIVFGAAFLLLSIYSRRR